MTKTLPITKARENLTDLVNKAKTRLDDFVITVNGIPAAVLMSADEYESWKETDEIMSDLKLVTDIKQGEKDINEGKWFDWEDVKEELGINV